MYSAEVVEMVKRRMDEELESARYRQKKRREERRSE